ncbi:N-acetyltransferase family protein [Faecousia sp.]|uniref:GNAT family N-acetyltransferase n=1 Tax=Faecousia sp. TaxID=2952921 RepID=UPI002A9839E5|nr:GNAT family N-acetyltransferase [Candidatus Faecousia sp.]
MLTFRTAAEPDFEHVNRLARQVHELHVSLHPDLYRSVKHPISCEEFREMVERDQLVVACRGEHIVAYAAFAVRDFDGAPILPRRVMMLDALCVDGPCRRQGIAHAMLEELCRRGRALGCTDLQLACDSRNTSALAFYEAQGMQRKLIQFRKKL